MAKKSAEAVKATKIAYASEFIGLILPRVMENFTVDLERSIEDLRTSVSFGESHGHTGGAKVAKILLAESEARMEKILTGEPARQIEKFYVDALVEEFTEEELHLASSYERFNVKFGGLAVRAETVLKEALGEATQGGNLETDAGATE